jgi:lipoprotein-anchoring transpeptidase ErfK/SrfK
MRWGLGLALVMWLAGGQVGLAADPRAAEQKKDAVTVASVAEKPEAEAIAGKASGDKVVTIVAPEKMDRVPTPVTAPKGAGKKVRRKAHRPSLVARIDLTHQRMHVSAHGELVGTWKISSGRGGYETPTGRFRPKWISRMHYSRKYDNSPMPYSVFFNGGIATHGTTAVSRLGQPASHGCIRLKTKNARTFFHLVRKHGKDRTRIVVTGHAKQSRIVRGTTPRRKRAASRRNAFRPENRVRANPYGRRRYSVNAYERRYRERVRRYYRSRRLVWPGDRY